MAETREADMTMKVGPDVPAETTRPLVAAAAHFRVLADDETGVQHVLYLPGAHVPAGHADLPSVPAELVDGVWVPKMKGRRS